MGPRSRVARRAWPLRGRLHGRRSRARPRLPLNTSSSSTSSKARRASPDRAFANGRGNSCHYCRGRRFGSRRSDFLRRLGFSSSFVRPPEPHRGALCCPALSDVGRLLPNLGELGQCLVTLAKVWPRVARIGRFGATFGPTPVNAGPPFGQSLAEVGQKLAQIYQCWSDDYQTSTNNVWPNFARTKRSAGIRRMLAKYRLPEQTLDKCWATLG